MKTALNHLLGCALFLLAAPALAEGESPRTDPITPTTVTIEQEFIRRPVRLRPASCTGTRHWFPSSLEVRARCSHAASNCARKQAPSWMVSRMPVLVPDGTPQTVYRAPPPGELP